MHCLFDHFVGNTSYLDVIKITRIAVSFHCGTRNAFLTHFCRAPDLTNVKIVIQKVGKDSEQNLMGCFAEFKINSGILFCLKRRNVPPVS